MNKIILLQVITPVAVPAAIATLKHFLPRLPKPWLPVLAPFLGALLEVLATWQVDAGTALGAALGAAGVGLREIVDQLRQALRAEPPNEGPGSNAEARPRITIHVSRAILMLLPCLAVGCRTPDESAFKTMASLEAAVDHAMNAWADYVIWKRAAHPAEAELPKQEQQVKSAYSSYRLAMSAAYGARAAYVADQQAGRPAWQARLDAARTAADQLLKLVDSLLQRATPSANRQTSPDSEFRVRVPNGSEPRYLGCYE